MFNPIVLSGLLALFTLISPTTAIGIQDINAFLALNNQGLHGLSQGLPQNYPQVMPQARSNPANPCTFAAVSSNFLYHPHPYFPNKFIQCDLQGIPHEQYCAPGTLWDQYSYTCNRPQNIG
ncbi:unnamed protein product [Gordionus sp. m RMFG-2023]